MYSYFLSESIITVTVKFGYVMFTSYKVEIIFQRVFSIINPRFSLFREKINAGRLKLFAEASELFRHSVFRLVICKTSSSKCIFQGNKKMELAVC